MSDVKLPLRLSLALGHPTREFIHHVTHRVFRHEDCSTLTQDCLQKILFKGLFSIGLHVNPCFLFDGGLQHCHSMFTFKLD